jgi:hypothetical protein
VREVSPGVRFFGVYPGVFVKSGEVVTAERVADLIEKRSPEVVESDAFAAARRAGSGPRWEGFGGSGRLSRLMLTGKYIFVNRL